jgi:hypothetical protein
MEEKRTSSAVWIAVAMGLLVVVFSAYTAGYLMRCDTFPPGVYRAPCGLVRIYPTQFEATLFKPAAKLESALMQQNVEVTHKWFGD